MGETTSIDDYHHHHIHAGHGDQQPQRHSSLGGRGSSQRDSGQFGYGIFKSGESKFVRLLAEKQHTQRKSSYFVNWYNDRNYLNLFENNFHLNCLLLTFFVIFDV